MAHENEYNDNMVTMLELIWGEGYMSPGGPGNVAKLLGGLETRGKRILDIGCGIGGPAFEMAQTFNATVVGIDLEAPLVERAIDAAERKGLSERCAFRTKRVSPSRPKAHSSIQSSSSTRRPERTSTIASPTPRRWAARPSCVTTG